MTHDSRPILGTAPRWAVTVLILAVLAALVPLVGTANAVPESYEGEIDVSSGDGLIPSVRFAGDDRFETAGLIATDDTDFAADFDADDVVLTRADIFPDALAGSRIGGVYEAPILLTPTDTEADGGELNDDLAAALDEIDPEAVHVLGSDAAVSETLTALIAAEYGASINRIGGVNRFETAALIADVQFDDPSVTTETQTVVVSNGGDANLVDALVSGAIGAAADTPILLTGGGGPLDPFTADRLEQLSADETVTVYVAGGPESLPEDVVEQIEEITGEGTVERIDGERAESLQPGTSTNTRFATAVAFAELGTDVYDFGTDHVNLARGDVFADALALGPHAGLDVGGPAPIVLSANDALSQETEDYFTTLRDCNFESLHLAGGTEALGEQVNTEARTVLSGATGEACDLTLTPETATNLVGESHTVTATLVDNTGETATALTGYEVDFETTTESGTALADPETATVGVDEDGTADFTFTSVFPGTIRIDATFTNADGETRTATALKEFVLPDLTQEIPNDLTVQLSSAEEVPPAVPDPGATGVADLELYPMLGIVCAQITVDKGTATGTFAGAAGAHIHEAPAGSAGPIVVPLPVPSDDTGTVDGCVAVDGALQSEILGDRTNYYVNVHTTDYPAGLVRGQLS